MLEGLQLLIALTPSSPDLQKLVAFENAFDRILDIVDAEGSLTHGGVMVQDCLSLLANLLSLNASNQSFFRETGGASKIAGILNQIIQEQSSPDEIADWAIAQRDKNLWGLLSVIRLFLVKGNVGTQANQTSFWQNGVALRVLDIAFNGSIATAIRAEVSWDGHDTVYNVKPADLEIFLGPRDLCRHYQRQQLASRELCTL